MVAFNSSILHLWKTHGYRFILVLPRDKYGVLRPLWEDKPVTRGYTIEISEMSLIQMAEDYFFTKEKDAELTTPSRRMSMN
jgi:hypothetical protein